MLSLPFSPLSTPVPADSLKVIPFVPVDTAALPFSCGRVRSHRHGLMLATTAARAGASVLFVDSVRACSDLMVEIETDEFVLPHVYMPDAPKQELTPIAGGVVVVPLGEINNAKWKGKFDVVVLAMRAGPQYHVDALKTILRMHTSIGQNAGWRVSGKGLTKPVAIEMENRVNENTKNMGLAYDAGKDQAGLREDMQCWVSWGPQPAKTVQAIMDACGGGTVIPDIQFEGLKAERRARLSAEFRAARHTEEKIESIFDLMLIKDSEPEDVKLAARIDYELLPFGLLYQFRATLDPAWAAKEDLASVGRRAIYRQFLVRTNDLLSSIVDASGLSLADALVKGTQVRVDSVIRDRIWSAVTRDAETLADAKLLLNCKPSQAQKPTAGAIGQVATTVLKRLGFLKLKTERKRTDKRVSVQLYELNPCLFRTYLRWIEGEEERLTTSCPIPLWQLVDSTLSGPWKARAGLVQTSYCEVVDAGQAVPLAEPEVHFRIDPAIAKALETWTPNPEHPDQVQHLQQEVAKAVRLTKLTDGVLKIPEATQVDPRTKKFDGTKRRQTTIFNTPKVLRKYFKAPAARSFISFDFGLCHLLFAGQASGDQAMIDAARYGEYYGKVASAFGVTRAQAKMAVSALLNGAEAWTLEHKAGFSAASATTFIETFRIMFGTFRTWELEQQEYWKATKKVKYGRLELDGVGGVGGVVSRVVTAMEVDALGEVFAQLKRTRMEGLRVVLPMHDGALLDVPTKWLTEAVAVVRQAVRWAYPEGSYKIGTGNTWAEAEETSVKYEYKKLFSE